MNWKRHLAEAATLAALALVCGVLANAVASSERKLALPGSYPNATKLPVRAVPAPEPAAAPEPAPSSGSAAEGGTGAATAAAAPSSAALPAPRMAPAATPGKAPGAAKGAPAAATAVTGAAARAAGPATPAATERLTDRFPPHADRPFTEIGGADVAWLHAHGALVLDARRTSVYQEGHIAGALSFPVWEAEVDRKVEALVGEARDPKQPVVLYCAGGDCEDSHMLAQKLFGAGFENLLVYRDGWPDWVKRGGAARTGPQP